ncbi:diguanylate phosphodiesterase [Erwinia sp.]|uniref:diguanylate phosphodiesterase n=1 Tax=Erwinia citreus TaxID=558 RepID=UPI003C7952BA
MLSTLLYRSHICDDVPVKALEKLLLKANKNNAAHEVTGILLFNGTHFFQLLEGPEAAVHALYDRICRDKRHHNLVEMMRDYAPSRRFGNAGMELFDLRQHDRETVLQAVMDKGTSKYQLTYDDRALQFLRGFVEARENEEYFEIPQGNLWEFVSEEEPEANERSLPDQEYSFAFQPIIDPLSRKIVSVEALMRNAEGVNPIEYFARLPTNEMYEFDLRSKKVAFELAKNMGIQGTLSVNLLPMSLVMVPDAVNFLLQESSANGFVPEQIVIEVTENEVISRPDEFSRVIKQLKAAGFSLAIDDFGAGSAGLLLLARFQPDKVKIDRYILADVHESGPKQAIVQAIIKCCESLNITVIAEGVEKPEEWMWLESAGISLYQGFLFARPKLEAIPAIAWPEFIEPDL